MAHGFDRIPAVPAEVHLVDDDVRLSSQLQSPPSRDSFDQGEPDRHSFGLKGIDRGDDPLGSFCLRWDGACATTVSSRSGSGEGRMVRGFTLE